MSASTMRKKSQKRVPRELFRSWLRDRTNDATPSRLTRNKIEPMTPVEQIVGSNILIIELILEHVKAAKDLLNCRLVNSHWTPIATARLSQLNSPWINFNYFYIRKCYLTGKGRKLSDFVECAKNSIQFPCTSFRFSAGDMRSMDANGFLTSIGSTIKTLTLNGVSNGTLCGDMNLTDIFSNTPKLETLVLSGGSNYKFSHEKRLMLPALKRIEFTSYFTSEKIHPILSGAPFLENIVNTWKLDDVTPIVVTNKIHAVKIWSPSKAQSPDNLIKLATATESDLLLSEMSIAMLRHGHDSNQISTERLWQAYRKLLNSNSIRKLILHCSEYPNDASFPLNMDNVHELVLMPNSHPRKLRHFPVGINLTATFPQVKTLSFYDPLHGVCCAGSEWEKCFPLSYEIADFTGTLPTVTTLNLRQDSASVRMLRKLKIICPNVQNVDIHFPGEPNKVKIMKELFGEWRNLKQLSIDLDFKNDNRKSLDSILTGLSVESLQTLMFDRTLTEREKLRKAEDTRHVLWIGSIRGLTKLDIRCNLPWSLRDTKNKILIPITEASGLFAFNSMPSLAVNLIYKSDDECQELQAALNSISPYATISRQQ